MDLSQTFARLRLAQQCLQVQGKLIIHIHVYNNQQFINFSLVHSVEYTWSDSLSKKVKLSAPQYIDYMTTSIQNILNDESIFPTKAGKLIIFLY